MFPQKPKFPVKQVSESVANRSCFKCNQQFFNLKHFLSIILFVESFMKQFLLNIPQMFVWSAIILCMLFSAALQKQKFADLFDLHFLNMPWHCRIFSSSSFYSDGHTDNANWETWGGKFSNTQICITVWTHKSNFFLSSK